LATKLNALDSLDVIAFVLGGAEKELPPLPPPHPDNSNPNVTVISAPITFDVNAFTAFNHMIFRPGFSIKLFSL